MPRIFDNIDKQLLPALCETLEVSERADFCVGYFNLRGWKQIDSFIESWSGREGNCCRLLVGMHCSPDEELREAMSLSDGDAGVDNQTAIRLKKKLAEEFRDQLTWGVPTNEDEAGLRRLAAQIKRKKVVVKLFLRHPLHAKLYLLFRPDPVNPATGFIGSSNLTFAGLAQHGELNVDVMDHDACEKLARWFEDCWNDKWCLDISDELARIIGESWAREELIPPYHIYIKMAYHLSQEARAGLAEFKIPRDFGNKLFEFQKAAVKIAAHHLNKRGGVLIGDVVGLGKTLMATAVARIFEDDHDVETLIICPKNLVKMWEDYREQYRMRARVLPITRARKTLADLRRYRLVLIDESHNLRNREGKIYRALQEYIQKNDTKCILLSATPYNKSYLDLSNQLRLFVPEDKQLGIRPEQELRRKGLDEFVAEHQCALDSLAAFEKSEFADDWRELMRLYMVRRTRTFIQENYAETDSTNGRKYLTFEDGTRSYFPSRVPKTVKFKIDDADPDDQYAPLYSDDVVKTINDLKLPRYGLGNKIAPDPQPLPAATEAEVIRNLSRAGRRLMGFCRTNLFKRLESSGQAFLLSVERHIVRNFVFLYAIENKKPLPIGAQDVAALDTRATDDDAEDLLHSPLFGDEENNEIGERELTPDLLQSEAAFKNRAAALYDLYATELKSRFKWLRSDLFVTSLADELRKDAAALMQVLKKAGAWDSKRDSKLLKLHQLIAKKHPKEKVIVFSQFADTVHYLESQLKTQGVLRIEGVTGSSADPTMAAWRFSPVSNNKRDQITEDEELRVLIATDILSEGQNLQDGFIIVNYDLPWAIIRLVQRAGRVDRIGQKSERILCYSFLPAEGVERIIRLRARVRQRLAENAEVVGTDEAFFEDDRNDQTIRNLFTEKAGIMDGEADTEVDLASYAYQIWKNAISDDPSLRKTIESLPDVVYSTKALDVAHAASLRDSNAPVISARASASQAGSVRYPGVLVYMRTANDNDALVWMNERGESITESQFQILKAAECLAETKPLSRRADHHSLVRSAVEFVLKEEKSIGGQLGRPSGARFRTYTRLKRYAEQIKGTLFESQELTKAIDDIYRYPLLQSATDSLNRQLRIGVSDEQLAQLAIALREEDRLCNIHEQEQNGEPQIICSMGLAGQ
jgi:superfamily II DNA or RNA helicase